MGEAGRSRDGFERRCARSQEAIWFAEQTGELGAANNLPLSIELEGRLDIAALRSALEAVVEAHPPLRTRFSEEGGRLVRDEVDTAIQGPGQLLVEDVDDLDGFIAERSRVPLSLFREPHTAALLRRSPTRHVLFTNFHHAIFDGTSKEIFARDFGAAYRDTVAGGQHQISVGGNYAEYVELERAKMVELEYEARRYWEPMLPRIRDAIEFPVSAHADPSAAGPGEALQFQIEPRLKSALDRAAAHFGVSTFVVLVGAVQLLQHVYGGRTGEGVATLIPLGTRPPNLRDAIGMFVNEVPLYTDFPADIGIAAYMRRIRDATREVSRLRLFPFNEAVARFGPSGDPRRLLPGLMVSYWKTEDKEPLLEPVRMTVDRLLPVYGRRWGARFRFLEAPRRIVGGFEYDKTVLHEAAALRAIRHFETVLEAIATTPDARLADVAVIPTEERRVLLSDWNDTHENRSRDTLQEQFEAQARRTPDRPAAEFEGAQITYGELNRRANRLGRRLVRAGAEPETVVGIYMERSLDLLVALLAVVKSGAGYVPLDPGYPRERVDFMLDDTRAPIVIAQRSSANDVSSTSRTMLLVDEVLTDAAQDDDVNPPVRSRPENLAYVIYTSGSTGKPKGTELLQSGVMNLIRTLADKPGLTDQDTFLSVTTLSFDIGSAELLAPLLVGGKVVIASADASKDGYALAELLDHSGATIMFGTPSRWRLAIAGGWNGDQTVLVGGEALPADLARMLVERSERVWNIYGPTETTIFSTRQQIRDPECVAIGRPVANTQLYVLDSAGRLAPIGITGELCIAGAGVTRGYVNRPDLTAGRFVRDPFGPNGARLYKTGDLVRYRDDGTLEFVGRIDDQVKIRGFRVEPGEVEAALARHPGVDKAVVIAQDDPIGGKRLVAYLVPTTLAARVQELRAALRKQLPDFMIPAAFVGLDDLPLNANGKIDRRQLPVPDLSGADAGRQYVAPRNEKEVILAEIWEKVLGVDRVGMDDNFFEIGGHSLLAAEVVAEARDALDMDVPLRLLFEWPTVAGMAGGMADAGNGPLPRTIPKIARTRISP